MKFQPGSSGNPAGRPKGIKDRRSAYVETIESMVPSLLEVLHQKALDGDLTAIKILLDRVLPARKPESAPIAIEPSEGLSNQAKAVMSEAMVGNTSPEAAVSLISALQGVSRIIETDELVKRIEAIECANKA